MAQEIAVKPRNQALAPQLPPALQWWLDFRNGRNDDGTIKHGWFSPPTLPDDVLAMIPAAIDTVEAALEPAPAHFIVTHLTRLAAHYPVSRSAEQWGIVFEDMTADLADTPPDLLVEAIRRHRTTSRFFPSTAELVELVTDLIDGRKLRVKRLCRLSAVESESAAAARKQREAERKEAERQAILAVRPDLRIQDRWRESLQIRTIGDWLRLLDLSLFKMDEATVDGWHADAAAHGLTGDPAFSHIRILAFAAMNPDTPGEAVQP